MAVTGKIYGKFFLSALNKELDWDTDTWKCMLTTSTYTPDQDTHQYKSSVTNEVTGTGYTAAGQALTSVTITYTGATNVIMLDCADPAWTITGALTARTAVFYDSSTATDGTFTVTINAAGIVTITPA
jgi:hypothetical protein